MVDNRKIILIGGGGMVARRLISNLDHEIVVTSSRKGSAHHFLDLSDFNENELSFIDKNDVILLTAAVSSPDICMNQHSA